jgi:membrane protease YdiL (CAAX protease family)
MQTYSILINAVMFSIMFLVIFLMLRKEIIRDIKLFFKNFSTYLNISTPIFILGFIAQILIGITLILITKTKPANQTSVTNMPIWFLIVFAIVIGPAVEEGFFRGFLGKFIKNKTTFIIVSSLLFSLMHVIPYAFFSPVQWVFVLQYAAVAVPISLVYAKTNNIATSYFFHLCWNSISLLTTAIALM